MRQSIDFDKLKAILDPRRLVPLWLPQGKSNGREWVAPNPMRSDNNPGSFSINLENGRWSDFATKDGGGDLISLWAYLEHGGDNIKAARDLIESEGLNMAERIPREAEQRVAKIDESRAVLIMPIPEDAPAPTWIHKRWNSSVAELYPDQWVYRNEDGAPLFYIARFDPFEIDGKKQRKQVLPRSWVQFKDGRCGWAWQGIVGASLRPLYGLDRLASRDGNVLIVEGEKAADAAQTILRATDIPVLSWMGGSDSAHKVDVAPLSGKRVILWPDFDMQREPLTHDEKSAGVDPESKSPLPMNEQPGMRAMLKLAASLRGVATEVVMVNYRFDEFEDGWDLADGLKEGWSTSQVIRYLADNASGPAEAMPEPEEGEETFLKYEAAANPFMMPHLGEKGAPYNTIENLLGLTDQYGIRMRYNKLRKDCELVIPGKTYTVDNRANCSVSELASLCARARLPSARLEEYIKVIADRHAYCPVENWIKSADWDGIERIDALIDTIESPSPIKHALMYRWLISCVAAIFQGPGFESHGVLVFIGDQGLGKTRWATKLGGGRDGFVLQGASIDPADKDSVTTYASHWIVELGELDGTFRKTDIARLKAFVTKPFDRLRRPYDRIESQYWRRTVAFASVNERKYLVDDTGNRRWWSLPVTSINYMHGIDMQQLWAEVYQHYQDGVQWYLTKEEAAALEEANKEHEGIDPFREKVLHKFLFAKGPVPYNYMTATAVLDAIGYDKPTIPQATKMAKVLRELLGTEPKHTEHGRVYEMPAKIGGPHAVEF